MILRVILGVLLIFSFFVFPWWLVLILSLASLFYFDKFYEIIIIAILADVLYGSMYILDFPYPITLFAIILLFLVLNFKKNLIIY